MMDALSAALPHLAVHPAVRLVVIPGPVAGAGLSGDFGGSYFLNHLAGAARARETYFSGQLITGARAQRIGLRGLLSDVLGAEVLHMVCSHRTEDHMGAAVACVERRPASFKGRRAPSAARASRTSA